MGSTFPVSHSVLRPSALAERVLPRYGLSDVADLSFYQRGFNDTYVAKMSDGETYYVRVYRRGWRTKDDALCELDAIEHLRRKGVPAAYPVASTAGEFLTPVDAPEGERQVAVFVEAAGERLEYGENAVDLCRTYGAAVAAMHNAWDDFTSQHDRFRLDLEHLIDQPLRLVEPMLLSRPERWEYLQRFAAAVRERIARTPALEQGFCHGDLQGWHAHMDEAGTLTFYDFDGGGVGFRAYDLAVFRWSFRFDNEELSRWEPFLEGYRARRDVADVDVEAAPLFVCARHIWHMGAHAGEAAGSGIADLHDAYYERRIGWLKELASDYAIDV